MGNRFLGKLGAEYRLEVEDNDFGLDKKVEIIMAMIRQSKKDERVRGIAKQICRDAFGDFQKIEKVYDFIQKKMKYEPDVEADDVFVAPHRQIERIMKYGNAWGDCDDYVLFAGSLLVNMGVKIRLVVVETFGASVRNWNHIFFEAFDRDKNMWIIFDGVRKGRALGLTTKYVRARVYSEM